MVLTGSRESPRTKIMPRKPERLPEGMGSDDVLLSTASELLFRFSFPGFRSPLVFQEKFLEQM